MNIAELQREAHAIAKDHGWWDEPRTFGDLIALVHSELSEALEAYRELGTTKTAYAVDADGALTKPEGVPYELADVVIRVADMAEHYGVHLDVVATSDDSYRVQGSTFGDWITMLHHGLSQVVAAYMAECLIGIIVFPPRNKWAGEMASFVAGVQAMADRYGINLDAAIAAKMEYNGTRSYRHGGKAL